MKSILNIHWKDWCWSTNSLVTWCEELTYWKRPWCWERLKTKGEECIIQSYWLHGLQHTRLPCPSLSPRVCSDSCQLSQWCYLTISSSAALFSFCLQSFLASQTFPKNWLFASGGQSIGASASASVLPVISFRIDWFDLLAVQGTLKSLLQHHSSKASILWH